MQRLVEQPTDDGELFRGDVRLGRVHYHLAVYQHFSDAENEDVPANVEVEGRLTAIDAVDLADYHRRGSELTLQLADGRGLDLALSDRDGRIRSTGRGLHRR